MASAISAVLELSGLEFNCTAWYSIRSCGRVVGERLESEDASKKI